MSGAAAAAALVSAPALAQGYNSYPGGAPLPPPGQGTYAPQPQPSPQFAAPQDELNFRVTLAPYGEWIMVPGVGEVWRPHERMVGPGFRPYVTAGHWVYTEYGWSWESDYPWGWAPFHYGRWVYRPRWGWLWRPARVWAPAWVEWRYGAGHVGWSPMPPDGVELYEPSPRYSWCFVDTPNFVSVRLPQVVLAPERARFVFTTTAPVARRGHFGSGYTVGPPPAHIATAVGRSIKPVDTPRYLPPDGTWRGHAPVRPPPAPPRGSYVGPPPGQGGSSGPSWWEGDRDRDRGHDRGHDRGWGRDRDGDRDDPPRPVVVAPPPSPRAEARERQAERREERQ
ncbi:MAG TPA: DUF6600 domain-containing protein, partial [Myxococcales bacterium]|nr:DUF6600 domain-containing protein [Myxococcales bacterium]